jgi:predicted regulator of Ras-like GTPase activity (Roadblock/LC7/MglB family)
MTTVIKRKFVCVEPISNIAKMRFNMEMDSLHSCYVEGEDDIMMFLCSVNKKYQFIVNKKNDTNWKLIK